ncbi:N-acetylmuramoyl-L-alanine amidase [Actinomycetota bacterium]
MSGSRRAGRGPVPAAVIGAGLSLVLVGCSSPGVTGAGEDTTGTPTSGSAAASPTTTPSTAASPSTATSPSTTTQQPRRVAVQPDWIPYPQTRKDQMAAYAERRYGVATSRLTPKTIVLHFTDGDSWTSARDLFAQDIPSGGERPNVCTHFVIDQSGTVHGLVPTTTMCRHAIGLNHVAIGIEFVQASHGNGAQWADRQILARTPQVEAGRALVRQLMAEHGIPAEQVIGHAAANDSPYYKDLTGLRNDHTDWLPEDVAQFRVGLSPQTAP